MRPTSKISTTVKTTCERILPSKSFLAPFITMGGYIVIMYFTGHHWLLLAPSELQLPPKNNEKELKMKASAY